MAIWAKDGDLGESFAAARGQKLHDTLLLARIPIILLTLSVTVLLYHWGAELFGTTGGFLAACLWAFDPTALAHGCLATTDVGATFFALAATWAFTSYLRKPTTLGALTSGILLGLAQAAKFSNLLLVPVWLVVAVLQPFCSREKVGWRARGGHALMTLLSSLLTLNSCYLWEGTGIAFGDHAFGCQMLGGTHGEQMPSWGSNRFRGTWLGRMPLPLPEYFVIGFDRRKIDSDAKIFPKYLRGEVRPGGKTGWWYYYLYGLLVKTPLGTLAIFFVTFTVSWWYGRGCDHGVAVSVFLATALLIFVAISAQTGLNSHFRYVMPSMAFLFLWCGCLGPWIAAKRWRGVLVGCALLANVTSTLSQAPYWLSYFHEIAGGPQGGSRHLVDSNLDWGQGLLALHEWRAANAPNEPIQLAYFGGVAPHHYGVQAFTLANGEEMNTGLLVVSANFVAGLPGYSFAGMSHYKRIKPDGFHWLEHREPLTRLANCLYVYHLAADDLPERRLAD